MEMTRRGWPDGWIPSDDEMNGRATGLLRMDNLYLDENGVLSLVPGTWLLNPDAQFPGKVETIYSRFFNNSKYRFVGLDNGEIWVQNGEGNAWTGLVGAGGTLSTFSTAFGYILISTGTVRVKYDGTDLFWLGLAKPHKPIVIGTIGQRAVAIGNWTEESTELITGTDLTFYPPSVGFLSTTEFGVISFTPPTTIDLSVFDSGGKSTPDDRFILEVRVGNTEALSKIRIDVILNDDADNYYWTDWSNEVITESPFTQGINALSQLEKKRKDFVRVGDDSTLGWHSVRKIKIQAVTTAITELVYGVVYYFGSDAVLNGRYQYAVVNVHKTNKYVGKSGVSEVSEIVEVQNGNVRITIDAADDEHANEYWLYRRSADAYVDFRQLNEPAKLDQFYRVAVIEREADVESQEYTDLISDEDALIEGITLDQRVLSLNDEPHEILSISEPIFGRIMYMTIHDIIVSNFNDPESFNPVHTITLSGDTTDKNLWIKVVGIGRVLIGTTRDIYEITGTWRELPDGSLDIFIRPLVVGFPPISRTYYFDKEVLFYIAADGIRTLAGTQVDLLTGNLDLLFRDQARYGINPVRITPGGIAHYPIAVYKNQVWVTMPLIDGSRRTFVYDIIKKYWHVRLLEPLSLFVEEDGKLLGGFGGGPGNYLTENYLRQLDVGTDIDGVIGQSFLLHTIYDDNGAPRNRKDIFTLKINGDTNFDPVGVWLGRDRLEHVGLGSITLSSFTPEAFFELASTFGDAGLTLGKRFSLKIAGDDLQIFKLHNFTIEYDQRPEQLNYLRIPPTNMGSFARKRWTNYAFVVDTLGQNVSFTPVVDNVPLVASTINTHEKLTHVHYFTSETIGTDMGGILWSSEDKIFEFYGLNLEETISEKLPTPVKYLVIPAEDYGVPNRKRHSSYKFQILTRGGAVKFTPKLDGVLKDPSYVTTSEKRTHEHFFLVDTIGIDIGGILESIENTPFEFYGVIRPQQIEVLPPRLKEFRIPENNYGIAAKKRIRTMPMEINTNSEDVRFVPIVDGVAQSPTTLRTDTRATAFHYFTTDVFGIDFSGELFSSNGVPFEFYGLMKPEEVEIIPVGKKFDQIGPVDFPRIGKLLAFRIRLIAGLGVYSIPYTVYVEDTAVYAGSFDVFPHIDRTYEVMQFPKTIWGTVFRIEFGPTAEPFHRYYVELKVNVSGMQTDSKWQRIK